MKALANHLIYNSYCNCIFLLHDILLPKPCFGSFFNVTQMISLSGEVLTGVSTVQRKQKDLLKKCN